MGDLVEMPNNANWLRGNPTVGDASASDLQLSGYQPEYGIKYPSNQHQANTTLTLATGKSMTAAQLGEVFRLYEDQWAEGWWFRMMPRRATTELQHEWEVVTTPFTSFDLVPENVGPRYVQEEQSKRSAKLTHWSQGAMVKEEFFMTEKGQKMFERAKNSISMNAVRHQKNMVAITVFSSLDFWREYRKTYGTAYGSLYDVVADGVRLFGALNLDAKGIYKLVAEMMSWIEGHPNPPRIGMGVTRRGTKLHILHGEPGNEPNPHSEMYRMGQASVDATLANNFAPITTKVGFPIFEDQPVADTKHEGLFDPFERIAQLGSYFVLQNDDLGAPDATGRREPQVQAVVLPTDKWRTFGYSEMLQKCLRFDGTGALNQRFHADLINRLDVLSEHYDEIAHSPDPFLVAVKDARRAGRPQDTFMVADMWGAQDTRWRKVDWDVRQGLMAAQQLSREDQALINRLLDAVASVYDVTREQVDGDDFEREVASMTATEPVWGGATVVTESAARVAAMRAPYGRGSIPNMMSYLTTVAEAQRPAQWAYSDINAAATAVALDRWYQIIRQTYAGCVYDNAAYCPLQHRTNDADKDKRTAMIANCLEPRAKYPVYYALGADNQAMDGWAAYGVGASTNLVAQNANVAEIERKFTKAAEGLKVGNREVTTLAELAALYNDEQGERTNLLSGIVGYLQTLDLDDWRSGSITEERIDLWRQQPASRTPAVQGADAGAQMTKATVVGSVFSAPLGGLVPANPYDPIRPLAQQLGEDNQFRGARAHMPGRVVERELERRAARDAERSTLAGANPTYADRQRPVVGPEAANVVGGPFLSFSVDGKKIVDRQFVVDRLESIQGMANKVAASFARAFVGTRVTRQSCESMIAAGLPPPMHLMLANPFVRVRTGAMVLAEGGSQLGEFLYSYQNSMFGTNTHHKTREFHYTLWMGGFVKDETKLLIKTDASLCGYESGMGDDFFERKEDYPGKFNNKGWETFPSMFVFDLPVECDRAYMEERCSPSFLMGKPDSAYFGSNITNKKHLMDPRKQTFPSWAFYDSIFHFNDVNRNRPYGDQTYMQLRTMKNAPGVMLPRACRTFNAQSGRFELASDGKSHLDRLGAPPIMPTLNGKLTFGDQKPFKKSD